MRQETKPETYPAQEIFKAGQEALEHGDTKRALAQFEKAAEKKNPEALYSLAELYVKNEIKLDKDELDSRLSTAKDHLRSAIQMGYVPRKVITLLNKVNDQILRELLKQSLQKPFENRDLKSFNSILTFLKVDDQTRDNFNLLYDQADPKAFEKAVKHL